MAKYIEVENYCENICRCNNEMCDKDKCPLWNALAADVKEVVREGWIKFELEYDEEEKVEMLSCKLPDDEEEIIVTDGKKVWEDTFLRDVDECYLDSGYEFITGVTHWMPKPLPPSCGADMGVE